MNDLMQQHLDTVRDRLKAKNLSRLELQQEAQQRLTAATDNALSSMAREMAQAEAGLLQQLLAASTPPPKTPAEQAALYRETGQHTLAEAIEYGLKIQVQQDKLSQSKADLAMVEGDDVFAARKRDLLAQEIDSLEEAVQNLQQETPFHQRVNEQKRIRSEAAERIALAGRQLEYGDISEEAFNAIEAEATQTSIDSRELTTDAGAA